MMTAVIGPEWVSFPVHGRQDPQAVAWLAKIVADNRISSGVYLTSADLSVTFDGNCPVEGRAFKFGSQVDRPEDRWLGNGNWRALLIGDDIR